MRRMGSPAWGPRVVRSLAFGYRGVVALLVGGWLAGCEGGGDRVTGPAGTDGPVLAASAEGAEDLRAGEVAAERPAPDGAEAASVPMEAPGTLTLGAHVRGHPACFQRFRCRNPTACLNCFESAIRPACCPRSHPFYCSTTRLCYRTFADAYFRGRGCTLPAARLCGTRAGGGGGTCPAGTFDCGTGTGCCEVGFGCCFRDRVCCPGRFPHHCPGSGRCWAFFTDAQRECGNAFEVCGVPRSSRLHRLALAGAPPGFPAEAGSWRGLAPLAPAALQGLREAGPGPGLGGAARPLDPLAGFQPLVLHPDYLIRGIAVGPLFRPAAECAPLPVERTPILLAGRGELS